jgi:hypothetical protein
VKFYAFSKGWISLLLLFSLHGHVRAQQDQVAATTSVSILADCPSFCRGSAADASTSTGGQGQVQASSELSNTRGNGRALVELTGPTSLPILKAEAYSTNALSRATAIATGMQGFRLGSNVLDSYTLNLSLEGAIGANGASGTPQSQVFATVGLMSSESGDISFSQDAGTQFYENFAGDLLGTQSAMLADGETSKSFSLTASTAGLAEGSYLYVWVQLGARGARSGFGEAYDTLTMSFSNAQGLTPLTAVPEPQSVLLFLAGAGLLMRRVRAAAIART